MRERAPPGIAAGIIACTLCGLDAHAIAAQNGRGAAMDLIRVATPIVLDGRPDDAAWQGIQPLPLTMYFPTFRGQPVQRTEIRVAYDDEYFYAAGWFWDDDPSGIRINSLYRDRWNGDDAFAIYIDAFNDNQTAKWFGLTPAGMRFDLLVSADGAVLNDSWDGFWDARTTVTADGWFAEVRIPFSTLGFQSIDGQAVMGLTVTRLVSRTSERVTFPDIDPRFEFRQPSQARDVVLRDVRSSKPVYVTPYVLGGSDRRPLLDTAAGRWGARHHAQREIGLDMRYALSANLTLDLTLNTDFAQVEADDQQINLDRFSLFFPEKRRFFQERSGIFDFPTGGNGQLFHSRRIGLDDASQPVPVQGGARLVGRAGEWDLGLIAMRTADTEVTPDESFGVVRLRRRVIDSFSTVGVMLTGRNDGDHHNVAGGIDGQFHLFGDDYLNAGWAASQSNLDRDGPSLTDRSAMQVQWQRRSSRGLWYTVRANRTGGGYDPGVGFLQRRDFSFLSTAVQYFIFTDANPTWRRVFPGMFAGGTYRNGDGVLESGRIAAWLQAETKGGSMGWIEPQLFREDVVQPFMIGNTVGIPAGGYTFANIWLYWQMPTGKRLRTTTDLQIGTFFDGWRTQLTLAPTWNLSRHLEVGGEYVGNFLRFGDRDQSADIHLARLRLRTALDAKASGNAFVQYNSTTDRLELNLRLRYNFAEGTDLWVVYNEGMATERAADPLLPEPPLSFARAFVVKFSRTFAF